MNNENHHIIAGALFDLMGHLTTAPRQYKFSSWDDSSLAVEVLKEFAAKRGLHLGEAAVSGWVDFIAEQHATPTAAVAAGTIDTPALRMMLADYRRSDGLLEQHSRLNAIISGIDAAITAASQKAREEADDVLAVTQRQLSNSLASVEKLEKQLAQRTAGGDAVIAACQKHGEEVESLHRRLAAETLRADQGWERYESANADRNALRAERSSIIEQLSEMKWRAIEAHRQCYRDMQAHPAIETLGDEGKLHRLIHAIVGVSTPLCAQVQPAPTPAPVSGAEQADLRQTQAETADVQELPALSDEELLRMVEEYDSGRTVRGNRVFSDAKLIEFVRAALATAMRQQQGDVLLDGYKGGIVTSGAGGTTIKLHYATIAQGDAAFSAITDAIDSALAAKQAGKDAS